MNSIVDRLKSINRAVLIIAAVVVVAVVAGIIVLTGQKPALQAEFDEVPAQATIGDLSDTVTVNGQVLPERDANLAVSTPGIVTAVNVKIGDVVKAGTVLVQLDDAMAKQNLEKAKTAVDLAQVKLDIAQHDLDSKINWSPNGFQVNGAIAQLNNAAAAVKAAQSQYDMVAYLPSVSSTQQSLALETATNNLHQAQANLDYLITNRPDLAIYQDNVKAAQFTLNAAKLDLLTAQITLDKLTLTAPFDGTITTVNVEVGESAVGPVVEIATMDRLEVVMDVDEVDVGAMKVGQPVTLTFDAWPGSVVPGKVTVIAPKANTTSGVVNFEVHVALDNNDLDLRAGITVTATIETLSLENVLLVPNEAVWQDANGKHYVALVSSKGTRIVEVTVGASNQDFTQILSGLKEGDQLDLNSSLLNNLEP